LRAIDRVPWPGSPPPRSRSSTGVTCTDAQFPRAWATWSPAPPTGPGA
jgi:hypothetical protein